MRLGRSLAHRARRVFDAVRSESIESYSQEGEDVVLRRLFDAQTSGFYVDIGAHHPIRLSNTYYFYRRGWTGLNVDAAPGCMEVFRRLRPRDINVEIAVGSEAGTGMLAVFDEPALNTLSPALSRDRVESTSYRIVSRQPVRTTTLAALLDEHVGAKTVIDFLTVDVEGFDEAVLLSNDWDLYRPRVVLTEALGSDIKQLLDGSINAILGRQGYIPWAKLYNTAIFLRDDFVIP